MRDEAGAVAVVVALLFTVFAILVALVVDIGLARDLRRTSQNSADAAALAGANTLYPQYGCPTTGATRPCVNDAVAAVKDYAAANYSVTAAEWTTCTATMPTGYTAMGGTSCIAFDSPSMPTRVWVRMPTRNVMTNFAGIIGKSTVPVSSYAEAQIGTTVNCSLCFLGTVDAGNADFTVTGGSIAVNGNVIAGPNSYWTSTSNGVVGTVSGGVFVPSVTPISSFSDPLASMVLPLNDPSATVKTDPCAQGPGIYNGNYSFPNNASCTLAPGLYVVRGTWDSKNNTVINATGGVTIYVPNPGYLDFKNGAINLVAPTTGPFKDLAIVYARDNTNPISLQGNGSTGITGTVYAPAASLDFNGNSCFGFAQGPIVVNGVIKANGNTACIMVTGAKQLTVTRTDQSLSQ